MGYLASSDGGVRVRFGGMVLNVDGVPGIDKPLIGHLDRGEIVGHDVVGQLALLGLELVVEDKDAELGVALAGLHATLLLLVRNVLEDLLDGKHEGLAGVVDLIHEQDAAAEQGHLGLVKVEPLGLGDLRRVLALGRKALGLGNLELLVEGQADGLDRHVAVVALVQEGTQDAARDKTTAGDRNHQVGLEVLIDAITLDSVADRLVDLVVAF